MSRLTRQVLRPNLPLRYRIVAFAVVWVLMVVTVRDGCDHQPEPVPANTKAIGQ